MKKFMLFIICLCGSVILFSQLSVAAPLTDMSTSVFVSTFEQTGSWSSSMTNGTYSSTNWSNSAFNSWTLIPTSGIISSPVTTGSVPSDFYVTIDVTFGAGMIDFYYNGTEYATYPSGTGTSIMHFVSGILDTSGSSMALVASATQPIYLASDNSFTGFYLNDGEIKGNVTYVGTDVVGGDITSISGSITGSAVPVPTPEPATMLLLGLGLMGLAGAKRKIKK